MEEALETTLSPLADDYLQEGLDKLNDHYQQLLKREFGRLIEHFQHDVDEQFEAWMHAFEDSGKLSAWIRLQNDLAQL
jgi:hypothetical protein